MPKIPLEKGYSQMDWLRLMQTHPNLNGLGGKRHRDEITMEEVRKHKTAEDAWMVLNGMVFNISPYLKFHPGGVDILMKAAGKDGTALFTKYHPWVNIGALIGKCLVGRLAVKPLPTLREAGDAGTVEGDADSVVGDQQAPSIQGDAENDKERVNQPAELSQEQQRDDIVGAAQACQVRALKEQRRLQGNHLTQEGPELFNDNTLKVGMEERGEGKVQQDVALQVLTSSTQQSQ